MPAMIAAAIILAILAQSTEPAIPPSRDVLATINAVRLDPAGYARTLNALAEGFDGPDWRERSGAAHRSQEGAAAVIEAAAAALSSPPSEQLASDPILAAAAQAHVDAQGPTGSIGHASAAGATPGLRVRAAGGDVYVEEVITYGMHDAEAVVRSLVVDDGVRTRGHRRFLLSPFFHFAGVACGPHRLYETMCVIDLSATPGGRVALPKR